MKSMTPYLCLSLLLGSIHAAAQTTSVRAVINTHSSQIVENITANQAPSLTVTKGSLLPLTANFSPITQTRAVDYRDWSHHIGQTVTVDSKMRALSYTGKLLSQEARTGTFSLQVNNSVMVLPSNDFYLQASSTPQQDNHPSAQYPSIVSYQSTDLSWSPKRTLIFADGVVSLINSAQIHNSATQAIQVKKSLLHYSPNLPLQAKALANTVRMSESNQADYQDNEVTYPLHSVHLAAGTDTLIKLIRLQSAIEKSEHRANIYTSLTSAGQIPLTFSNILTFRLSADAFPGQYQTFWQRDGLLIPSNHTQINIARANHPIEVTSNKSLDISGQLTLINKTSQKLPTTQTWELTVHNHSNKIKTYRVMQSMRGIISQLEGKGVKQINASSAQIEGEIQPQSSQTIRYQVSLKE
ncbi:hypothetical protein [Marinomonas pollencensis]|uniref:DUF4139 domain-containing protein n=1 Tax=Marinomonas pollencensis TaxID=491954 RepID=A0A3E0DNA6_9GAMM|nr:hypothetical protein [Marinomonas pollencensis]REG84229.1 hypothetical protein DFP81_104108 [Marinomonas pollencensis]